MDAPEIMNNYVIRIYKLKPNVHKYLNKPPSPIIFVFYYQIVFLLATSTNKRASAILLLYNISSCWRKFKPCYFYCIKSISLLYVEIVKICQWGGIDAKYISQFQFYAQTCRYLASLLLTLDTAVEFWRLKKSILNLLLFKLYRKTSLSPFTNFRRPQKSSLLISLKTFTPKRHTHVTYITWETVKSPVTEASLTEGNLELLATFSQEIQDALVSLCYKDPLRICTNF